MGGTAVLLTFTPHPQKVISPMNAPPLLQMPHQKECILSELGIDVLVRVPFSRPLSRFSPEKFVRDVLVAYGIREIYVGNNFRFGYKRAGSYETLVSLGQKLRFGVHSVDPVCFRGKRVSSTAIRDLLSHGRVALCRRLLNRPYQILGTVVRGAGKGTDLGFPTANIQPTSELVPANGVYVTIASVDGVAVIGATNIGCRPTLGESRIEPVVETHLLDVDYDLYGKSIELDFWVRLRQERCFQSVNELKVQVGRDLGLTRKYSLKSDIFRKRQLQ